MRPDEGPNADEKVAIQAGAGRVREAADLEAARCRATGRVQLFDFWSGCRFDARLPVERAVAVVVPIVGCDKPRRVFDLEKVGAGLEYLAPLRVPGHPDEGRFDRGSFGFRYARIDHDAQIVVERRAPEDAVLKAGAAREMLEYR